MVNSNGISFLNWGLILSMHVGSTPLILMTPAMGTVDVSAVMRAICAPCEKPRKKTLSGMILHLLDV